MNIYPIREINFTAGRTKILSDFDGTFMPKEFDDDLECGRGFNINKACFSRYFSEFDEFLKEENNNGRVNELTITTGRNLPEFNHCMREIKSRGLSIPIPDRLITVNGGDEFLLGDNGDYFSSNRENMFEQSDKNPDEQNKLSKFFISYDPKHVLEKVKDYLSKIKKSNSPAYQKPNNDKASFDEAEETNKPALVSMERDGGYLIRLAANSNPVIHELRRLPDILEDEGYAIYTDINPYYKRTAEGNSLQETQYSTSICMKPITTGKVKILDKYHHAKILADEIMKNNSGDLIIVAGDGRNDINMLDLSNYSDNMKSCADFSKSEFRAEAAKIPLRAIFIRNSSFLDDIINKFERNFNFDGKKRFIVVDKNDPTRPSTLLEAIKIAKEDYAGVNPKYKENM